MFFDNGIFIISICYLDPRFVNLIGIQKILDSLGPNINVKKVANGPRKGKHDIRERMADLNKGGEVSNGVKVFSKVCLVKED